VTTKDLTFTAGKGNKSLQQGDEVMSFTAIVHDGGQNRLRQQFQEPKLDYVEPPRPFELVYHDLQGMARTADREIMQANLSLRRQMAELDVINDTMHGLLDSLELGVVAVDIDTKVVAMNHTAEALLGVRFKQVRGTPYSMLCVRFADPPQLAEAIQCNEQPAPTRKALQGPDGKRMLIESSISLIRNGENTVLGAVNILKDLSPMEEMEKKLQRNARLASIGRMASTLAHDIRNPLTAIAGFSRLLAEDMSAEDPRRRFAENIIAATEALDQAVTATLVFARAPKLELRNLNPMALLEDVKEFVAQEINVKGYDNIKLKTETRLGLGAGAVTRFPSVVGDAEQLKRALLNLTRNAIEAMSEGGTITLRLSCAPGVEQADPMLRFSVADTGPGINPEIRQNLFEPFETTKEHGTGLGLPMVKKVAELHSGRVSVETRLGKGTVFHIDLPTGFVVEGIAHAPSV